MTSPARQRNTLGLPDAPIDRPAIAYFSMEIGLEPAIPTYAGGLGVLAGDILRSAADLEVPMIGVTLLHRKGYFRQELDARGIQSEAPQSWSPEQHLRQLEATTTVEIDGRPVRLQPWLYRMIGITGAGLPVLLLDSAHPDNTPEDRALTDELYGGDSRHRLAQEAILGLGGVAALRELGYGERMTYHMNEGHSSLLVLALLEGALKAGGQAADPSALERVRRQCVFTTHTPVSVGHDQFPSALVERVLGGPRAERLAASGLLRDGALNMTDLGLRGSRYVNAVSMRHGQVSREMFPDHQFSAITNGVHVGGWTAEPFARLFDRHLPGWRHDNRLLRYALGIPLQEIRQAHAEAKSALLTEIRRRTGRELSESSLTLGFARRATAYKRADLLLKDVERLRRIGRQAGPLQLVYSGKAHPRDDPGKAMVRRIFEVAEQLGSELPIVYLADYDMALAKLMTAGVDIWLNTPIKPREASGTSGMKAACNGVPNLSVLDGWWIEGHIEGVTGWSVGDGQPGSKDDQEAAALYDKLEQLIVPMFYQQPERFAELRRGAVAHNGSYFNTQRVVSQYVRNAYCDPDNPDSFCAPAV